MDTVTSKLDLRLRRKVFSLFSLSGEESLYKPFLFDLELLVNFDQWQHSWLFETAELLLPDRTISGIITSEKIINSTQQNLLKIHCKFEPRFSILRNQFLTKIFLNKNIQDIFQESLLSAGYNSSQIQWQGDTPTDHPYIFQAPQESDQDFLKRLFSNENYFYGFKETIFADNKNNNLCVNIKHTAQQPSGPQGEGKAIPYHTVKKIISKTSDFYWTPVADPKMPLLFTAHIESENTYAELDDQGNYTHRLKLDESEKNYTQAMPSLKKLSPYSNLHFPLRDQAEVLVAYLYGFSAQPIIMGSLHNTEQLSPVISQNYTQHIFKSQSGNLFCADDSISQQQWLIQNPQAENYLFLNATQKQLNLSSQGNVIFNAESNIMINSNESTTEKIGSDFIQYAQQVFSSITQSGNLTHQSKTDYLIKSKSNFFINSSQDLLLRSKSKFILQSHEKLLLLNNKQFSIQASPLIINSGKNIQILGNGKGSITLSSGSASIEITQEGNININASQIGLTGQPLFSMMPM